MNLTPSTGKQSLIVTGTPKSGGRSAVPLLGDPAVGLCRLPPCRIEGRSHDRVQPRVDFLDSADRGFDRFGRSDLTLPDLPGDPGGPRFGDRGRLHV